MKTKWMRSISNWGGWGAVVIAAATAGRAMADVSVTLRSAATVQNVGEAGKNAAVTIGDVALVDPPTTEEAARISEIVVIPAGWGGTASTASSVSVAQVRAAMDGARVHWGKTSLRGSVCQITVGDSGAASGKPAARTTGAAPQRVGLSQATPQTVDIGAAGGGPETIRQAVGLRLTDLYGVDPSDLRIAFDEKDEEFLGQPVLVAGVERRVDVQPGGTGGSVRTPVSIAVYEGDRIVATRAIAVQTLLNRTVVSARVPIARGQVIGEDVVEVSRQWMGPNAKMPASAESALGLVATRAILAGAVLTSADLAMPVACKRGDTVWVHALSGPLTVKAKCIAQGTARDGEMVQLKMDGSGSNRVFSARMSGVGRAVMLTDSKESKP